MCSSESRVDEPWRPKQQGIASGIRVSAKNVRPAFTAPIARDRRENNEGGSLPINIATARSIFATVGVYFCQHGGVCPLLAAQWCPRPQRE
jgi:hypothetical protein